MKNSKLLLDPIQKRVLYLTTGLLWLTGAWWLFQPAPLWLKIHGAVAMAFLMVLGTLLIQHVPMGWKQEDQRSSGGPLLAICILLVISGWGLYYFGDEQLRRWTSLCHIYLGLFLPAIIAVHVWLANRKPK